MDSRYKNGKIYKIISKQTDKVYIGSTIQTLNNRFKCHKTHYRLGRNGTSVELLQYGDASIELIENYPCDSPTQLKTRERFYIENTPNTVNMAIPSRTHKEYREDNREKIKLYGIKYRKENIEKEQIRHKKYYLENREKEKIRKKKYWEETKDRYKAINDYRGTWCGNYHHNNHNNLLYISPDIFKDPEDDDEE